MTRGAWSPAAPHHYFCKKPGHSLYNRLKYIQVIQNRCKRRKKNYCGKHLKREDKTNILVPSGKVSKYELRSVGSKVQQGNKPNSHAVNSVFYPSQREEEMAEIFALYDEYGKNKLYYQPVPNKPPVYPFFII